ncbi:unnamed protein product [Parascedosporium putredinis]|uniref:Proteasome inhibitor PI31 subunit n=1 Tax=Parascedosporium putredinis TaxID=1442378 RepID=A0A9P1GVV4_9PEZI|nr:unnamed protein product [Parascedosporium putredinis]CAI7987974.1 unnamed protein product [Parascedosporium putredinis]
MADAIPPHPQGDSGSDLSSSYEVLALLIHAYMAALKFRLQGFNEDTRIAKVEVRGLAVGDDKIYRFERNIRDVVRSSGLPVRIKLNEDGSEDRSGLAGELKKLFVSDQALEEILDEFKVKIVQKFIPKLQLDGYEETPDRDSGPSGTDRPRPADNFPRHPRHPLEDPRPQPGHPYPINDPLAAPPPRRPIPGDFPPPDFEDEHEINTRPRGPIAPGSSPFNIGHDDLYPSGLGPHDPIRSSLIGQGGLLGRVDLGDASNFDDPLFQGPGGNPSGAQGFDPKHLPEPGGIPSGLVAGRGLDRAAAVPLEEEEVLGEALGEVLAGTSSEIDRDGLMLV